MFGIGEVNVPLMTRAAKIVVVNNTTLPLSHLQFNCRRGNASCQQLPKSFEPGQSILIHVRNPPLSLYGTKGSLCMSLFRPGDIRISWCQPLAARPSRFEVRLPPGLSFVQNPAEISSSKRQNIEIILQGDGGISLGWMGAHEASLAPHRLCDLVLAGTHNAATYACSTVLAADGQKRLSNMIRYTRYVPGNFVNSIIQKWAICQDPHYNIYDQLMLGVRYLDLRVCKDANTFRISHTVFSVTVREVLHQIRAFLESPGQNREIVFVDFKHFYAMDDQAHEELTRCIATILGPHLAPFSGPSAEYVGLDARLDEVWSQNRRAFVFYHHENHRHCAALWPGDWVDSPWMDTSVIDTLHTGLSGVLRRFVDSRGDLSARAKLHVIQCILTPKTADITAALPPNLRSAPSSLEKMALGLKPHAVEWIKEWEAMMKSGTVLMVDWITSSDFINLTIRMNFEE